MASKSKTAKIIQTSTSTPHEKPKINNTPESGAHGSFFIVALGASAGGLAAIEELFKHMPASSGMAFVVITHMDPHHKGMMPELLQKMTPMRVQEVHDGVQAQPDNVYVIPSNSGMAIMHGKLHLIEPPTAEGIHMSIDYFLQSLAQDRGDRAIGIILSGMGSDGSLGIISIKEHLGMVMVQEPGSAEFSVMPQSAVNTGLADFIAPVSQLPEKLMEYIKNCSSGKKEDIFSANESTQNYLDRYLSLSGHTRAMIFPNIKKAAFYAV